MTRSEGVLLGCIVAGLAYLGGLAAVQAVEEREVARRFAYITPVVNESWECGGFHCQEWMCREGRPGHTQFLVVRRASGRERGYCLADILARGKDAPRARRLR